MAKQQERKKANGHVEVELDLVAVSTLLSGGGVVVDGVRISLEEADAEMELEEQFQQIEDARAFAEGEDPDED